MSLPKGLGIGWRPQLAMHIERRSNLAFIEILADNHMLDEEPNKAIQHLKKKGIQIAQHSIGLSLGGAHLPDLYYIDQLNRLGDIYGATVFSEHIALVRSGCIEAGHLLPVKRTEETLAVLVENINFASSKLKRPLVLENIASFVEWPGNTIDEAEFLSSLVKETDCNLLLDISNLLANSINNQFDACKYIENLPLSRIEYMHVAGGIHSKGVYHDTHGHALNEEVLDLLKYACELVQSPSVLLERDDMFPRQDEFFTELDNIENVMNKTSKIGVLEGV